MHEGSIFHEVRLLHKDTFARRQFCTRGLFCTKDQICTKTHLHGLKTFIVFLCFFLTITITPKILPRSVLVLCFL